MTDQDDMQSEKACAATHRVLCAHADEDGQGAHWLEPDEACDRPRAADLLESEGMRQVHARPRSVRWSGRQARALMTA